MHRQGSMGRRRVGVDPVVHQDRHPERAVRQPCGQAERLYGLFARANADRRARGCAGDPYPGQRRHYEEEPCEDGLCALPDHSGNAESGL
jgi:hypothetical protein